MGTTTHVTTVKIHDLLSGDATLVGTEVLVDRLWPRGIKKDAVPLAGWMRTVAPSADLRDAYHRGELNFTEFANRYREELDAQLAEARAAAPGQAPGVGEEREGETTSVPEIVTLLAQAREASTDEPLVLVFAAKDREQNHAKVLAEWLEGELRE